MEKTIPTILCADDEPHNLILLEAMLAPRGYEVETAENGREALSKLRTGKIDICLLDVMMPNMDGFEVCRQIKSEEAHRRIPVIMITSLTDRENRIRGIEAGAEDFISKPFDSSEVLARIKMLLHVKELNDRLNLMALEEVIAHRRYEKILLEKNSELENFAHTVSHDLKSPLLTIQAFAGIIVKDLEAGNLARVRENANRIRNSAEQMNALVSDLLELCRIGKTIGASVPIDMNQLVRDVLTQLAGPLDNSQVLTIVQPDLPRLHGDPTRMAEVVQNLVENAIKYMGDQPYPRIGIGVRYDGAESVFFVCDNGAGVDPIHHERIFGLFNKLDATSDGTGIGLSLVRRIIEVHGGRVWVESDGNGLGSSFCFTIPEGEQS